MRRNKKPARLRDMLIATFNINNVNKRMRGAVRLRPK
jgi:hypothetical protein